MCKLDDELNAEQIALKNENRAKLEKWKEFLRTQPNYKEIPKGLTRAPFKWEYHGTEHDMTLASGFVGYERFETDYIRPVVGWAIGSVEVKKN